MKTVKTITHCFKQDGVEQQRVVGIYSSDKIGEAIDTIKKTLCDDGKEIIKDTKDCCNYYLEFKSEKDGQEYFYTGDYILNELNL